MVKGKKVEHTNVTIENSFEYQTANDLFKIMAKNNLCDLNADKSISTQDLIILYKNMDAGTKLMTAAKEKTTSNQYIETVVYNDGYDSEGSDLSDICNKEDLRDVCLINNENIDFINNIPSFHIDNSICHKFGSIKLKSSTIVTDYDKHFLFKDLYIKDQLKNMDIICSDNNINNSFIPTSLLDYICCKRLEDNYNFYMDNVIKYVKHTIDQLKRISNGDYLTDKAKEKWREVNEFNTELNKNIVLANSVSIPIQVQGKHYFCKSIWDDIIHSEIDVRCLNRLLEKKITLEIPKLMYDSYKLFCNHRNDSLVIKCLKKQKKTKSKHKMELETSNLVIKIENATSEDTIKIINPTVILKLISTPQEPGPCLEPQLALSYMHIDSNKLQTQIEFHEFDENSYCENKVEPTQGDIERCISEDNSIKLVNCKNVTNKMYPQDNSLELKEDIYSLDTTDELRCTVQRLSMQSPVLEENEEMSTKSKKSPTRIRIKSPYENKSLIVEEKKRKKLLEIRQRRERRKLAMTENSKVTKHKYCKNALTPQASSSVTKLSITNKSFYTSIYGQTVNMDNKDVKTSKRSNRNASKSKDNDNHVSNSFKSSFEKNDSGRSYVDNTDAEFTYVQLKQESDDDIKNDLASSSNTVDDFNINLKTMHQLMNISVTDLSTSAVSSSEDIILYDDTSSTSDQTKAKDFATTLNNQNIVPANTPKVTINDIGIISDNLEGKKARKLKPSVECRKSIDKLYDLMKKLEKTDSFENWSTESKFTSISPDKFETIETQKVTVVKQSDSESSIKHQLASSRPSCYSFEKPVNHVLVTKKAQNRHDSPIVIPKVVINTKLKTVNFDENNINKKKNKPFDKKVIDNPLKAISELLHKFDNVQKTRNEKPLNKKSEGQSPVQKSALCQLNLKKGVSQQQNSKEIDLYCLPANSSRDKKLHQNSKKDKINSPRKNYTNEEKKVDKVTKNSIEIMDEVKELRGEAVRGPRQFRLNNLAQPKKMYVQAHNEEFQNKYGKGIVSNRLQKITTTAILPEKIIGSTSLRNKQRLGSEANNLKQNIRSSKLLEKPATSGQTASHSPNHKNYSAPKIEKRLKTSDAADAPETLKKIVAVESYVKNHYRRPPRVKEYSEPHNAFRSRKSVVSRNIDMASVTSPIAEESTSLRNNRLHLTIDPPVNAPLSAVVECNETLPEIVNNDRNDNAESSLTARENLSGSDFFVDIFGDKNVVTAVADVSDCKVEKKILNEEFNKSQNETIKHNVKSVNYTNEIKYLENALCRRMVTGAFQNKLRIKNLTLTPKPSSQKVLVLQSGDAGSSVMNRSPVTLEYNASKSSNVPAIKSVPTLSKAHIDLRFAKFPTQITTVGYSFPEYQLTNYESKSKVESSPVDLSEPATLDTKQCDLISNDIVEYFKREDTNIIVNNTISISTDQGTLDTKQCDPISDDILEYFKREDINIVANDTISITTNPIKEQNLINNYSEPRKSTSEKNKEARDDTAGKIVKPYDPISVVLSKSDIDNDENVKLLDITHCTHLQNEVIQVNTTSKTPLENIDNTTSLDILVRLLNEIRKITIYSANMPFNKFKDDDKKFEEILNAAAARETCLVHNPKSFVSFTCLDNIRQLESDPSIYSFYLSSNDEDGESNIRMAKAKYNFGSNRPKMNPWLIDKEVNVDMFAKECIHMHTDVPSFVSLNVNRFENAADSINELRNESSNQYMVTTADYQPLYTKASVSKYEHLHISADLTNDKNITMKQIKQKISKNVNSPINESLCMSMVMRAKDLNVDPILKFKRDLLVTFYSMLVVTVFAALSFPEFLDTM